MADLQKWIQAKWAHYRKIELAGSFYFLPYFAGLFSTAKPEYMGPWADLLPPLDKAPVDKEGWGKGRASLSAWVEIDWPCLSGPGVKCERLRVGSGHVGRINWFDPKRPVATPTPVCETIRQCWRAMPPLRDTRAPELIVTVTRGRRPAPHAPVVAAPLDGQPGAEVGCMTDPAGRAWLVLREPGRYRITCAGASVEFTARRLARQTPPGFADVPRVSLRLP